MTQNSEVGSPSEPEHTEELAEGTPTPPPPDPEEPDDGFGPASQPGVSSSSSLLPLLAATFIDQVDVGQFFDDNELDQISGYLDVFLKLPVELRNAIAGNKEALPDPEVRHYFSRDEKDDYMLAEQFPIPNIEIVANLLKNMRDLSGSTADRKRRRSNRGVMNIPIAGIAAEGKPEERISDGKADTQHVLTA